MSVEQTVRKNDQGNLILDPFSFHLNTISRIKGLGGGEQGHDPNYAFHTPYVEAAPGPAHFIIKFRGLRARQGVLQLWVNMLPGEPGANARVANSERVQLNRIVKQHGEFLIKFEGFIGVRFALHGQLVGDTDAEAEDLFVLLDRPIDAAASGAAPIDAKSSAFGRNAIQGATQLVSFAAPTLTSPLSQIATEAQLRSETAEAWILEAGVGGDAPTEQWSTAYILQVLDTFGMLRKGAVGLGLLSRPSRVIEVLTKRGLLTTIAALGNSPAHTTSVAEVPTAQDGASIDTVRTFDPELLPGDLINFDFLWSESVVAHLDSLQAGLQFIEASIGCLRPGGLAVHVFPYAAAVRRQDRETIGRRLFERGDVERIALILISRRFEVAQIKINASRPLLQTGGEPSEQMTRFGLIVRRPASAY